MVRPLQQCKERGGLWQYIEEPRPFGKDCPFSEYSSCCLRADDERAADVSFRIPDRTVAEGPVDIDQLSVTIDRNQLIFVPAGLTAFHDVVDQRTDDGPDLGPALLSTLAQGRRMLIGTDAWTIRIVIELDQVFPPPEEHGLPGTEKRIHGRKQKLRPPLHWANRSCAPVEGADPIRHLARAVDGARRTIELAFRLRHFALSLNGVRHYASDSISVTGQ